MIRLDNAQIAGKLDFMRRYIAANNAADGSTMDANANTSPRWKPS